MVVSFPSTLIKKMEATMQGRRSVITITHGDEQLQIDRGDYEIASEIVASTELDLNCYTVRENDAQKRIFLLRCTKGAVLTKRILQLDTLERLELHHVHWILPPWIDQLRNLKHIEIRTEFRQVLPPALGNISNLEILRISSHQDYPVTLPSSLTRLRKLSYLKAPINCIPESIELIPNLKNLELKVSEIPPIIGQLQHLEILNLSWSTLQSLPDYIGNLENLQVLDLSFLRIKVLPETIGNLRGLKQLIIDASSIQVLPETIGNLKSLQVLRCVLSSIKVLPRTIGNLESLRYLDLTYAGCLENIPSEIGSLKRLERLYLYETACTLPSTIFNLKRLRELHLPGFKMSDPANKRFLFRLVSECPHLSTLHRYQSRINIYGPKFQYCLMGNWINARLFTTKEVATSNCDEIDIRTVITLWPYVFGRIHCYDHRIEEQDALYYLLSSHGATIFEAMAARL